MSESGFSKSRPFELTWPQIAKLILGVFLATLAVVFVLTALWMLFRDSSDGNSSGLNYNVPEFAIPKDFYLEHESEATVLDDEVAVSSLGLVKAWIKLDDQLEAETDLPGLFAPGTKVHKGQRVVCKKQRLDIRQNGKLAHAGLIMQYRMIECR
jgi:hypothetical protein